MPSYNKIILMGHITRDPELNYTPAQTAIAKFGIATNRKWKGQDGQAAEEVCFVDCTAFGKAAETLNKYVKKGDLLFLEGRLKFDQWTAQDGTKRSKHGVVIDNFWLMSSNKQEEQPAAQPTQSSAPAAAQQPVGEGAGMPEVDIEIPF